MQEVGIRLLTKVPGRTPVNCGSPFQFGLMLKQAESALEKFALGLIGAPVAERQ